MLANSGKVRIFAPVKTKQWSRSSTETTDQPVTGLNPVAITFSEKQNGRVAQLNRVADYGSAGYRFESCRGHFYQHLTRSRSSTE